MGSPGLISWLSNANAAEIRVRAPREQLHNSCLTRLWEVNPGSY